tara:strand:+ start:767 stop:1690 length:924 start_codon:yes stop_codon:yes gene_type:complete
MADEKKKKDGVTFKQRVERSMGTDFGKKKAKKILEKDKAKGNDPNRIVAFPPKRGPGLPKQGVSTAPPKPKKPKQPNLAKPAKLVRKGPALGATPKKNIGKGQAEGGANPLKGKPRSIAEAKKRGEVYFFDSKGVKKIAATAADLKRTGLSLKEYANKFAPKKQTKKQAEALKGFAATKKRGGGVMKKKGARVGGVMKKKGARVGGVMRKKTARVGGVMRKKTARVGGVMKKKNMAAGGRTTMKKQMMRGGGMTGMKKKMMAGGGAMKKKGYAIGGAMKKKGMKKGGKVMKMRGGGLATRGTNFRIR